MSTCKARTAHVNAVSNRRLERNTLLACLTTLGPCIVQEGGRSCKDSFVARGLLNAQDLGLLRAGRNERSWWPLRKQEKAKLY